MRTIENFRQARQALSKFITLKPGIKPYTLDQMTKLMNYLDNPQNNLKIIHVAGTSGKTSTSYFAAALLKEAGYKVGLTVSPHIDEINERVQINLTPLEETEYCKELSVFLKLVDTSGFSPSYFEVLIAFAYWIFDKYHVDYAVIETGLGGLLDSTNVVNRSDKVCVITDIGTDHTNVLGDTLTEIALQKAGIIQRENTTFMHSQREDVMSVIKKVCDEKNAKLHILSPDFKICDEKTKTLPPFQQRNFQLAMQAISYAIDRDDNKKLTSKETLKASSVYIPARMEIVSYHGKTLVIDGSHNEQKIKALIEAMREEFPSNPVTLLVSFGKNKQSTAAASLALLRQLGSTIIITSFGNDKEDVKTSVTPELLATYARSVGFTTVITESNPLAALKLLEKDIATIGLITGSFYLLNYLRPVVKK